MSNASERARVSIAKAQERLGKAHDRLGAYLDGTLQMASGVTFQDLKDDVIGCREVLLECHRTLQTLVAQHDIVSPASSITSITCKSQSITGRCSTGRHVDRSRGIQRTFKLKVAKRDGHCIATGESGDLVATHIVPLQNSELITRDKLFSPCNGVLLKKDLEDDYDRHMWYFDYHGNVTVLFSKWNYKNIICHVNVSNDPETGPSKELIELHNQMALQQKQHHCPNCWKYVGAVNIHNHTLSSCEGIDRSDDK